MKELIRKLNGFEFVQWFGMVCQLLLGALPGLVAGFFVEIVWDVFWAWTFGLATSIWSGSLSLLHLDWRLHRRQKLPQTPAVNVKAPRELKSRGAFGSIEYSKLHRAATKSAAQPTKSAAADAAAQSIAAAGRAGHGAAANCRVALRRGCQIGNRNNWSIAVGSFGA